MVTDASRMLLMVRGRKTAHDAYFDTGAMICSATQSRRLHQHAVIQTRRRVTSRRGLCTNLRMTNSQKIITDIPRKKSHFEGIAHTEFSDVIRQTLFNQNHTHPPQKKHLQTVT